MKDLFIINDVSYSAYFVGDSNNSTWMIRRWKMKHPPDNFSNDDYTEALITVNTTEPLVAIDAAIKRESWA